MKLLGVAASQLQSPKIKFTKFTLSRAGSSSKYPGAVYVNPPQRQSGWYARINLDGTITHNKSMTLPGLEEELAKIAASPHEYAANYGRTTGICCFCAQTLTDPRSLLAGFGPICAERYGLPWGDS